MFNQVKSVINMIVPIVSFLPIGDDIKNQVRDIQTKLNAIPTIEQLVAS